MVDFLGNELEEGDLIIYSNPYFGGLEKGRIDSFAEKMVRVKFIYNKHRGFLDSGLPDEMDEKDTFIRYIKPDRIYKIK